MESVKQILSAGLFFLLAGIGIWTYNISTNRATSVATDVSTSVATEIVTDAMKDMKDDIVLVATDVSTSVAKDVVSDAMNDSADDLVNRVTASLAENNSLNVESNLDLEEITNTHPEMTNNNPNTSCENIKFEIGSSAEPQGITYEQRCEMLNRFIDNIRSSGSVCDTVSYFTVRVDQFGIEKKWNLQCNSHHYIHKYNGEVIKTMNPDDMFMKNIIVTAIAVSLGFLCIIAIFRDIMDT